MNSNRKTALALKTNASRLCYGLGFESIIFRSQVREGPLALPNVEQYFTLFKPQQYSFQLQTSLEHILGMNLHTRVMLDFR